MDFRVWVSLDLKEQQSCVFSISSQTGILNFTIALQTNHFPKKTTKNQNTFHLKVCSFTMITESV